MDCIRWCRNRNFYISLETQLSTAEKAAISLWTFFTKSLIDVCYELATLKCTYRHQRHRFCRRRRWRRAGDSRRRQLEDRCCIVVAAAAAKKKSIFCRKYFQEVVKTFDAQKVVAAKRTRTKRLDRSADRWHERFLLTEIAKSNWELFLRPRVAIFRWFDGKMA